MYKNPAQNICQKLMDLDEDALFHYPSKAKTKKTAAFITEIRKHLLAS